MYSSENATDYDSTEVLQMINILKELLKYFEPAQRKQLRKFSNIEVILPHIATTVRLYLQPSVLYAICCMHATTSDFGKSYNVMYII